MSESRRQFLANSSLGLLGIAVTSCKQEQKPAPLPPGAPPAFATAPAVGPEVSPLTFAEAEKLVQVELSEDERKEAVDSWRSGHGAAVRAAYRAAQSRAGSNRWRPGPTAKRRCPGSSQDRRATCFCAVRPIPGPLPASDEDIAFAPVTRLSRWIETRKLTSERLTNIYLQRIERFNPTLLCVITPTRELALAQAKQADQEIAAGHYRGPLARHSLGRQGSARHGRHSDHLWCRAFQEPRAHGGCSRGQASARGRRGAGRQAEHGRVGAQRCLVWRADKESLAAGGRVVRLKRRAGRCHRRGAGGLCHRQRDRRQHRRPQHALRSYRACARPLAGFPAPAR